jgi:hypothetical protein
MVALADVDHVLFVLIAAISRFNSQQKKRRRDWRIAFWAIHHVFLLFGFIGERLSFCHNTSNILRRNITIELLSGKIFLQLLP